MIAIDGPSGAGKSTVAALLARTLGLQVLDTGAMYRAVAWLAAAEGVAAEDGDGLARVAQSSAIRMEGGRVEIGGHDATDAIRTLEVGQAASRASTFSGVRHALAAQQRALVSRGRWVLEGRDTTTVVAPDADLKVFLTASIEERARRRWMELRAAEPGLRLQTVVRDVVERDHRDYTRADSPLVLAEDAHIVETFGLDAEAVAARVAALCGQ